MENELNMCWRRMTKKSAIPNKLLLSYDSQMYDNEMEKMSFVTQLVDEKLHENMIGNAIASFLIDLLNEKEKTIVQSLVYGLTQNEIAEQLKCKQQNISYFVSQIKKKWTPYLAG
jgi:DNA-directed RNA polymerase specialized sigma subunit